MTDESRRFAGAFLINKTNQVLLQLRDANARIDNPGRISAFGGSVEPGETFKEGLTRELKEELGYGFNSNDLVYLSSTSKLENNIRTDCEFYFTRVDDVSAYDVAEGTGLVLNLADSLVDDRITPTCRRMLRELDFKFRYALATGAADAARLDALDAVYGADSRAFVRKISEGINPKYIIDYGCGHGQMTFFLATIFAGARVYGIDASIEQLNIAREKHAGMNKGNLTFIHTSELSSLAQKADMLFSRFVLIHQADRDGYLDQLAALCTEQATTIFIEPDLNGMISLPYVKAVDEANRLTMELGLQKRVSYSMDKPTISAITDRYIINDFFVSQPVLCSPVHKSIIARSFDHISKELIDKSLCTEEVATGISADLWTFVSESHLFCAGMKILHVAGSLKGREQR